jgi:16S rRNA U516 pseudouridylate synthase RsuA-like enzyme
MNVNDPASITHKLHSQNLPNRLFPVGRLDKDSHGLLLLTNHGDLCHRLLSPDFVHSKRYLVTVEPHFGVSELGVAELGVAELGVNDSVAEQFVRSISAGVQIKGELTQPCQVEMLATNRFAITLTQGRNRQIRLMALAFGYRVVDLQRVSIVNLELADLPLDQWRSVDEEELAGLLALCEPAHQQV